MMGEPRDLKGNDMQQPGQPLPQWQSHKKVWADKVVGVTWKGSVATWHLKRGGLIEVSSQLLMRVPDTQVPNGINGVGGYYVRYEDGFESWSPAKAFEEGYKLLKGD